MMLHARDTLKCILYEEDESYSIDQDSNGEAGNIHKAIYDDFRNYVVGCYDSDPSTEKWNPRLSPSPMLITFEQYENMLLIQQSIHAGAQSILQLWWQRDPDICNILSIPEKIENILRRNNFLQGINKNIGCYRPDILIDEHGCLRVCEINARFTLNGYILSYFMAKGVQASIFDSLVKDNIVSPIAATLEFPKALMNRLKNNRQDTTIYCISNREPGHDISWLTGITDGSVTVQHICSTELAVDENSMKLMWHGNEINSCILELHQDEILALSDAILTSLMTLSIEGNCLNPLWSIFLLHDKRLLSLLRSLETHQICMHEVEAELVVDTLQKAIIPTVVCDVESLATMVGNGKFLHNNLNQMMSTSLVVKPALLGKGEGIIFQKDYDRADTFVAAVRNLQSQSETLSYGTSHNLLVVQPFIRQKLFDVAYEPIVTEQSRIIMDCRSLHGVATLLCMDDHFYGPGIFRFSPNDLIALASGGIAVVPIQLIPIPSASRRVTRTLESMDSECAQMESDLRKNLVENGVAVLTCTDSSHLESQIASFLENEWGAAMKEPAAGSGAVWKIAPMNGIARSHQFDEFRTHTDASYEENPPRYFVLAVKSSDKKGGGRSGFARISDAIEQLHDDEFDILRDTQVKWIVPKEFKVNPESEVPEYIMAPVIMSRERARIRPDIMDTSHLPEHVRKSFQKAFSKFDCILQRKCNENNCMLPEGTVLFMDNQRYVHCRTFIKDSSRCLIRIRFDLEASGEIESVTCTRRLSECPITTKQALLRSINSPDSTFHGIGGMYWSPSGGSTSLSLTAEQCAIPTVNAENKMMRRKLTDQLRQFGAISNTTVMANLMASGNLYRSMEILNEVVVSTGGTDLTLGAQADEESIIRAIQHFKVNTLCGWPSKLLKLVSYARLNGLEHILKSNILCVIHGGEILTKARKDNLLSSCAPGCKLFGIFGSSELGIFASTKGNPDEFDVYYVVPDTVHVELLDDDKNPVGHGEVGTIVGTNLIRKGAQRLIRFWMDDRAAFVNKGCDTVAIRIAGRALGAIVFPLGPVFICWSDIEQHVLIHFERLLAGLCVVGQIWIDQSPHTGNDRTGSVDNVTLKVFLDKQVDDFSTAHRIALEQLKVILEEIPNLGDVNLVRVPCMTEFAVNSRSNKLLHFVDTRPIR